MPSLSITADWTNSGLPLPRLGYAGEVNASVDVTPGLLGRTFARERGKREYPVINVVWELSASEMETFESFWNGELDNGAAVFILNLRYPKNTALTQWAVQFISGYQFQMAAPGRYSVGSSIQLVTKDFTLDDRSNRLTGDNTHDFEDSFESYVTSNGAQDIAPFPTTLNGGHRWDNSSWIVTLGT